MKKYLLFSIVLLFLLFSCFNNTEFEGISYRFQRADDGLSKSTSSFLKSMSSNQASDSDDLYHFVPLGATVACNKIIFPSIDDAQILLDELGATTETDELVVPDSLLNALLPNAIVAYNESTENPKILDLDSSQVSYLDTMDIALGDLFWGMILQTVYMEFEMEDFKIRHYKNDYDDYYANDVMIKRNGENEWKYLYNQYDHGSGYCSLLVSDTRKEDLFFWSRSGSENPRQDTTVHIMYEYYEDWDNDQGEVLLYTNCKTSTDENNYGRLDNLIAGFSMNVYYQIGGGGNSYGLRTTFPTRYSDEIYFSDIDTTLNVPLQIRMINSVQLDVSYDDVE